MINRTKKASEIVTYTVDFVRALETVWRPGVEYQLNDYVRPTTPNGFEYLCSNAGDGDLGQSAQHEPQWPTTIDDTIADGSLTWTCKDYASNAADSINSRVVTADSGITVDSSSISGSKVLVTLSGGTVGRVYEVEVAAVTSAGDRYEETLRVAVSE